jgi:hypothetical protein
MLDFRDIWVVLHVKSSRGSIRIEYSDGSGRYSGPIEVPPGNALTLPGNVNEWMASQIKALPGGRPGMRNDGPVPLPVFVEVASPLTWSAVVAMLHFADIARNRLQFVHLTPSAKRGREPFRLPFNVLTLGPAVRFGLQKLLRRPWLANRLMREHALMVQEVKRGELRQRLGVARQDILFLSEIHRGYAFRVIASLPWANKPRLVVDCSDEMLTVPEGVSLLHAPGSQVRRSLGTEVLFALIHDLPLHEMLKTVTRKIRPAQEFSLYSNPSANQDLRILDAYLGIHRQGVAIRSLATGFDREALAAFEGSASSLRGVLEANSPKALAVGAAAARAVERVSSFKHETTGLLALAKAGITLAIATNDWMNLESKLHKIRSDRGSVRLLEAKQQRAVDVALERAETKPFASCVSRETSLKAGALYHLRIHIGNSLAGSLMKETPPPVDALLPAMKRSDGHHLFVAIQEKEFQILSSNKQPLFLPRLGASKPVYFPIRTPREKGPATLRILLYFRNQLLQAFLLKTLIISSEEEGRELTTVVELEFSQTARFTNLPDLKPRALSVVANDNLDGTHEFFLFGKSVGKASLGDEAYVHAMEDVRAILKEASLVPGTTNEERVFPKASPGDPAPADAAMFLRRIADKGREVYRGMFGDLGSELPEAIRRLQDLEGETIQIVRLRKRLVIPWSMLYDYQLPETHSGEVCLGLTRDKSGGVSPCSHTPKDRVYCIRGFWGVRHIVEERIASRSKDDAIQSIVGLPSAKPLCVAMDMTVKGARALRSDFVDALGATKIQGPVDANQLLNLLWQVPPERPTVLVVLGHLETRDPESPGEPKADRIVLVDQKSWLTHESISDRFIQCNKAWEQPRPLVLLMACAVATTNVSRMNDFVLALHEAGAGAIVGTECVVFASLVCPFAKWLTLEMWKAGPNVPQISLGKAMRAYRTETLQSGNPLAFVFRSIGNTDLVLHIEEDSDVSRLTIGPSVATG